jgi:regulator of replication initiation timing
MNAKALCDQLVKGGCRRIRLTSADGETLVPANQYPNGKNPDVIAKKCKQIITYINELAPDGEYCIEGQVHVQSAWTKYQFTKGEKPTPQQPILNDAMPEENVLTYRAALEMQNKIAKLEAENARLNAENDSLNEDIDELEAQLAEAQSQQLAGDPKMDMIAQGVAILPGLIDKWFAQRDEANRLKREELEFYQQQKRTANPRPEQNTF